MKLSGRVIATAMLSVAVFPFASGIAAADDAPPPIVEDFDYPGADQIYAQYHIRLLKGDGHILFADCASGGTLVKVWSRAAANDFFCFRITGESGYLTMDVPDVYAVTGDQHQLKATVVVKDVATPTDIPKNTYTPVGEGIDPKNGFTPLVELRSGKS
ncbi:hypothetical protein ACWEHA_40020 [Amycolatopsis nivea]